MNKFFLKRLVVYPGAFAFLWYFLFEKYPTKPGMDLIRDQVNVLVEILSIPPPFDVILYGVLFGYVYGTISTIVSVKEFKSIILVVVIFFAKVIFSGIIAVSFGVFLFPLEVLLLPILIMGYKKYKHKKMMKLFKAKREPVQEKNQEGDYYVPTKHL